MDTDERVGCFVLSAVLLPMLALFVVAVISAAILTAVGCYKLVAMMLS